MELFVLLSCLLGTTFAIYGHGHDDIIYDDEHPKIYSRRGDEGGNDDNGNAPDVATVVNLINNLLQVASEGIAPSDLAQAVIDISVAARSYLDVTGGKVNPQEFWKTLEEACDRYNITRGEYGIFDNPLEATSENLAKAFVLLKGLAESALQSQESGQSPRAALAAINKIASIIHRLAVETVNTVTYLSKTPADDGVEKRDVEKRKAPDAASEDINIIIVY